MFEVRQNNVIHTWERSQENNYKIDTWYTCDKLFFFSTLNSFLRWFEHNTTQLHGQEKHRGTWGKFREQMDVENGTHNNTWLKVNQEMLEHTTLWHGTDFTQGLLLPSFHSQHPPSQTRRCEWCSGYGRTDSVLIVKWFFEFDSKHRAPTRLCH